MDSISRKFRQSMSLNSSSADSIIVKQYQTNLKLFLKKVDEQVFNLISKYENQIKQLKRQNKNLKERLNQYQSNPEDLTILRKNLKNMSPISKKDIEQKAYSNKSKDLMAYTTRKSSFIPATPFKSYLDYSSEDFANSRFQTQKNKNKIIQQNLLLSLQAGKYNLDLNTTKFLYLFGKNKETNKIQKQEQPQIQVHSTSENNQYMNSSISLVCESLDNSFHGKKSKKKNQLKRKQKQRIKQMKLEEAKLNYKQKKQQGLKNLLKNIRKNVSSTEQKPLEKINNLKIAHSVYDHQPNDIFKQKGSSSKSKVLIDPNPIDISQRNFKLNKVQSPTKPQSILKNTSTILSKSILSNLNYA